jgi:hypothetical protein
MEAQRTDRMFNFTYEKSSAEIIDKASSKVDVLAAKVEERGHRVAKLRDEYGIDDKAMAQLYQQRFEMEREHRQASHYNYSTAAIVNGEKRMEEKTVGAGVVNDLFTENDFIKAEQDSIERLNTIVRNLRGLPRVTQNGNVYKSDSYALNYEELEFLGF